jgi:hypothetical protein
MNATQLPSHRKVTRKTHQTSTRPVTEILLELAYRLHASKVVKRLQTSQQDASFPASRLAR